VDHHTAAVRNRSAGAPAPVARARWRRAARSLRAARIIHPFPTLLNGAATAGLAFVAAGGAPDASLLIRLVAAMLCAQSAIGVTNDYFDQELDARTKPWKPIVAGLVSPPTAVAVAVAFVIAALALALTMGLASLALMALGTAAGITYDVWLKRTRFSVVPFMVAIPTLPAWVWVTLDAWHAALWWIVPLGALTGVALHLANTLPDIDDDRAHGVEGFAHRLGPRRSMFVGWMSFALALALSALLAIPLSYDMRWYAPAGAFAALCLAGSIAVYAMRRDQIALQAGFGALGIGSAVVAVGWLGAVG
jgi:4-hydroxybenzoate polyprenyltransferase